MNPKTATLGVTSKDCRQPERTADSLMSLNPTRDLWDEPERCLWASISLQLFDGTLLSESSLTKIFQIQSAITASKTLQFHSQQSLTLHWWATKKKKQLWGWSGIVWWVAATSKFKHKNRSNCLVSHIHKFSFRHPNPEHSSSWVEFGDSVQQRKQHLEVSLQDLPPAKPKKHKQKKTK